MSYKHFFNKLRAPTLDPTPLPLSRNHHYTFPLQYIADDSRLKAPKAFYGHLRRYIHDAYQRCKDALSLPDEVSSPEARQSALKELESMQVQVSFGRSYPHRPMSVELRLKITQHHSVSLCIYDRVNPTITHSASLIGEHVPHTNYNRDSLLISFMEHAFGYGLAVPDRCYFTIPELAAHPESLPLQTATFALLRFGYHTLPKLLSPENTKFREEVERHYLRKIL